jgi:hypothetical protein
MLRARCGIVVVVVVVVVIAVLLFAQLTPHPAAL